MKPEWVRQQLNAIERCAWDDEVAHGMEDALYLRVLRAIAKGDPNARDLAVEAVKADAIEFSRWRA